MAPDSVLNETKADLTQHAIVQLLRHRSRHDPEEAARPPVGRAPCTGHGRALDQDGSLAIRIFVLISAMLQEADFESDTVTEKINDRTRTSNLAQHPEKDPDEWTTGDEPMTGPQASYLATLLQQAGRPESDLDPSLTKSAASKLIDELQQQTGRGA